MPDFYCLNNMVFLGKPIATGTRFTWVYAELPAFRKVSSGLPKEVVPTEELVVSRVALVGERRAAVGAADARRVPRALQNVQQELVQDRLLAAGARHRAACLAAS